MRFQSAWRKAEPSARAKASSGIAAAIVGSAPDEARPRRSCSTSTGRSRTTSPSSTGSTPSCSPGTAGRSPSRSTTPGWRQHRGGDRRRLARRRGRRARVADQRANRPIRAPRGRIDVPAPIRRAVCTPRAASRSRSSPAPTGARSSPSLVGAGLADAVGVIVSAEDVTRGKPHPEGYVRVLGALRRPRPGGHRRVRGHRGRRRGRSRRRAPLPGACVARCRTSGWPLPTSIVDAIDVELVRSLVG